MTTAKELAQRYVEELRIVPSDDKPYKFPEFTVDELDVIREHVWKRLPSRDDKLILHAYDWIVQEWGEHRCSVCGRTELQRAADGWNCTEDC